jgi:hypothetical protein
MIRVIVVFKGNHFAAAPWKKIVVVSVMTDT